MGLDMYLNVRLTAYRPWNPGTQISRERAILETAANAVGLPSSENIDYITIEREAAYWRKANAIHNWFVENVQGGADDCKSYYVGREQLQELIDLCKSLLEKRDSNEALSLLPPREGFFFGGTEVNDWYWETLADTVQQLEHVLQSSPETAEFQYTSSW